jgi:hypothetical protein
MEASGCFISVILIVVEFPEQVVMKQQTTFRRVITISLILFNGLKIVSVFFSLELAAEVHQSRVPWSGSQ